MPSQFRGPPPQMFPDRPAVLVQPAFGQIMQARPAFPVDSMSSPLNLSREASHYPVGEIRNGRMDSSFNYSGGDVGPPRSSFAMPNEDLDEDMSEGNAGASFTGNCFCSCFKKFSKS